MLLQQGWRQNLHDLVTSKWLGLAGLTLGGNYGESTPKDLSFTISSAGNQLAVGQENVGSPDSRLFLEW